MALLPDRSHAGRCLGFREAFPIIMRYCGLEDPDRSSFDQHPICWGLGTGPGWDLLLWEACTRIESLVRAPFDTVYGMQDTPILRKHLQVQAKRMPFVAQVKSKFGSLRIEMAGNCSYHVHDVISHYENMACHYCESCGKPAEQLRFNGGRRTSCRDCRKR